MAFKKGNRAWNKVPLDEEALAPEYMSGDPTTVRRWADEHGVSIHTIYARLDALGVPRRKGGCANRGTQARENNPNWRVASGWTARGTSLWDSQAEGRNASTGLSPQRC